MIHNIPATVTIRLLIIFDARIIDNVGRFTVRFRWKVIFRIFVSFKVRHYNTLFNTTVCIRQLHEDWVVHSG